MNLSDFKIKWEKEIEQGIVKISQNENTIVADRFDGNDFLCDRKTIDKIQADLRKLGYIRQSMGVYRLDGSDYISSMYFGLQHYRDIDINKSK